MPKCNINIIFYVFDRRLHDLIDCKILTAAVVNFLNENLTGLCDETNK